MASKIASTSTAQQTEEPFKRCTTFTDTEEPVPDFINNAPYRSEPKQKRKRQAIRRKSTVDSEESDLEFINNAPYHEKPMRKRKNSGAGLKGKFKKVKVGNDTFYTAENPLRKWLGSDLDVSSDSEPYQAESGGMEDEEEIEQLSDHFEEGPSKSIGRIKAKFIPTSKLPPPQPRKKLTPSVSAANSPVPSNKASGIDSCVFSMPAANITNEDESVTEPDSEEEMVASNSPVITKAPPPKDDHESITEPDSEEELAPVAKRKIESTINVRPIKRAKVDEEESVTEPDSDEEEYQASSFSLPYSLDQSHNPRPYFPSISPQPAAAPFVIDGPKGIQVNAAINRYLRDYQREGVQFFYERYKEGRGGILGDDMGLGKTIQVIAFLAAIMKKTGNDRDLDRRQEHVFQLQNSSEWRKHRKLPLANETWPTALIIVPSSVVHNWEREFQTWGYFEVGIYAGTPKDRAPVLRDFDLGRLDIVITSSGTALKDIDYLESKAWSCIFIDEAHRVKNANSQTTIAFNRFDCLIRFGLTGTAIQNNYTEFWTILNWSNPGRLGTLAQWNNWVTKPLIRARDTKATPEQVATGKIIAERLVYKLLPNFFKRRTKDIIATQLPKKVDQIVFCPLSETQKIVYKRFLATPQVQTMLHRERPCDKCRSGKLGKGCHYDEWDKSWVFQFMNILIKISNHLALILPAPIDTPEQTQRHRELANIAWPPIDGVPQALKYGEAVFDSQLCGKWRVLKDLLEVWRKDPTNKVLVFTKSVKLLEMLEHRLKESFMNFRKLDGSVKQSERMTIVDQFNEDPDVFVFLISVMAGGVGLNLVSANKVIIFDPSWNPAHDLQAQDRAFRFGQRRDVYVYRFLGAGSLEELIYKRQLYKQQQMKIGYEASNQTRYFEGVQGDKTKQGELFGIKNIFKLDESGSGTKINIERSRLEQLDWALTNMEGAKVNKTDQDSDMKGLANFLLNDEAPVIKKEEEQDDIFRILNSNGVSYTHHNDTLLKPSAIEASMVNRAIQTKKQREREVKRARKGKDSKKRLSPEPEWPPKRKHHRSVDLERRLIERCDALKSLGYIETKADIEKLLSDKFSSMTEDEWKQFIAKLDAEVDRMKMSKRASSGGQ